MLAHVIFNETHSFVRSREGLIDDDELDRLKISLVINPERAPIIPGSGGLRKLR